MKPIIIFITTTLFWMAMPVQQDFKFKSSTTLNLEKSVTAYNEFIYTIQFPSGKTAECKQTEGMYTVAYYNGPLPSNYPNTSANENEEKRNLIILKNVVFNSPVTTDSENSGILTIKTKKPSTGPGITDQ
ncbi:hypothetical protein MTsPCn9_04980 [Croceitalea sp. MTPC9]|uniref:hypothetical protein n=1 Tax=unclassified Croceitalea TaxID=2632280 RepID=UPI002B365CDE|nr:hypothetical protein MTsPCn6_03730 [Croceitalea sp. MTPC6]GMN15562.1 hypothetical protein MTsPCn9_04980 [Croceitalea sp. MTPC9]